MEPRKKEAATPVTLAISTVLRPLDSLVSDFRPNTARIFIIFSAIWAGVVIFYLLFFYGIKKSSNKSAVSEAQNPMNSTSWFDLPTEEILDQLTIHALA